MPWLKSNGTPLTDTDLKAACRSWDFDTWAEYLHWYEKPCKEVLIRADTYSQICEKRTQTLHDEVGPTFDQGLSNFCKRLLKTLPSLEAKVLRLYFFEGLTELEIAGRLKKTQNGVNYAKKRAISRLSAQGSSADLIAIHIMRGLDSQNEIEVRSPWSDSRSISLRQNRRYLPEYWKSELEIFAPEFLRMAMHGLSEDQRRIVYLRFWCDWSFSSIAHEIGTGTNVIEEICAATVFRIKSRWVSKTKTEFDLGVPSCA